MDILKDPVPRADVVVRFGGFEILAVVVQAHVAGGHGFVRPVVVFDVVGAQPRVRVANLHIAVGRG